MKVVQKISVFVLITFIITSSLGISFYLHQCGCRETTLLDIEAGYAEPKAFCCCSDENDDHKKTACANNIEEDDCCNESYFFLLIPFAPEKVNYIISVYDGKIIAQSTAYVSSSATRQMTDKISTLPNSPPTFRTGKDHIIFFHQMKIPSPSSKVS
jgi:hypothetical protein